LHHLKVNGEGEQLLVREGRWVLCGFFYWHVGLWGYFVHQTTLSRIGLFSVFLLARVNESTTGCIHLPPMWGLLLPWA